MTEEQLSELLEELKDMYVLDVLYNTTSNYINTHYIDKKGIIYTMIRMNPSYYGSNNVSTLDYPDQLVELLKTVHRGQYGSWKIIYCCRDIEEFLIGMER